MWRLHNTGRPINHDEHFLQVQNSIRLRFAATSLIFVAADVQSVIL